MTDINIIINRKKEIMTEINIYQKKLFLLENELLQIETVMSQLSETNIADSLSLSPQQQAIVESKEKNILVVACPGSGKTHTIISRYIHLVSKEKVDPSNIILITFTKKAGMEMNQRIGNILPHKLPYYVGSLHGLGFRLLQEYNKISYTVLDEDDSHVLLRKSADNILDVSSIEDEEKLLLRKQIIYIYDKVSNSYPSKINEAIAKLSIGTKYKTIISTILKEYKEIKKSQNLVDFNDLMIQLCILLATKKIIPFLNSIKYIFFDEYQDINPVQNYILSCFNNSNIMAVGDDAQSIYSFRGSSVRYIWEFEKNYTNVQTFYLETNYRSTPTIVNFCQDIISHNINQFKKNVKSSITNGGMKPIIVSHLSNLEQYKWVANDIAKKKADGISLRDMVVLSRKNSSLDLLEQELRLTHSINVVKSIGISLLNKLHIKDFIAFLVIICNNKSTIHWKRILSLHRNIGISTANEIICMGDNIMDNITKYNINSSNLTAFYDMYKQIIELYKANSSNSTKKIIYIVQNYLFNLWEITKQKNIETRKNDIIQLISYMKNQTIEEFISNIHLNLEIDNMEESLFISTVHSSKGLEWEYVYIVDMDCVNFPNIRQSYYKDEMDSCMEERRLFYVAASRAKKYLSIHFTQDFLNNVCISPFIRELDATNYIGSNLKKSLEYNYKLTGYISTDVNNHLRYNGYERLSEMILMLETTRENIGISGICIPTTIKNKNIIGNMMDVMVSKMIHNHYTDKVGNFELTQNIHNKLPETIYHNYIDPHSDWRHLIDDIFYISSYNSKADNISEWKEYLTNSNMIPYYNSVNKAIIRLIDKYTNNSPNIIKLHYNITYKIYKGECDILLYDNVLIEMKTTADDCCVFSNLSQVIMYGWLLKKKNININKVMLLNLWDGTLDTFIIPDDFYNKFKKILYMEKELLKSTIS